MKKILKILVIIFFIGVNILVFIGCIVSIVSGIKEKDKITIINSVTTFIRGILLLPIEYVFVKYLLLKKK